MRITDSHAPTGAQYYVWWFPGAPLKVHLSLDVVSRLREQIELSGPAAGKEGLLFGRSSPGVTEVLDFEPVSGGVPEAVAGVEPGGNALLVGYCRLEYGDKLRLSEADLSLAQTSFTKPYQVLLQIQPTGFGPPNASFYFHTADGRISPFSMMEFPFDVILLAGEEQDRLLRSQQAAARRSAAQPVPASPSRVRSPSRLRRLALLACCALLVFVVGVAAAGRLFSVSPSRPRVPAAQGPAAQLSALSLGLRARRTETDVEITWNRESPVVAAGISGILSIQDGTFRREIALKGAEVHNRTVIYAPSGDHIAVQLAITTPVAAVTESVMVLLPNRGPATTYSIPSPKDPRPTTASVVNGAAVENPSPPRPLKKFAPPAAETAIVEPEMPPLPALTVPTTVSPSLVAIPTLVAQAVLPPVEREPAAGPPAAPGAAQRSSVYYPAQPVRKIVPRLPPHLLSLIAKPATIEVRVEVDTAGRVVRAEGVPQRGISSIVMEMLVATARNWTFTPARSGDVPLRSEFVLQFHFAQ